MKNSILSLVIVVLIGSSSSYVGAFSIVLPNSRIVAPSSLHSASVEEQTTVTAKEREQEQGQALTAATEEKKVLSYLDDGFVFGLEGSGLERPKGKSASLVVEGDSLETQPWQVAVVVGTFLAHAGFAGHAIAGMADANNGDVLATAAQVTALTTASWILADFGSGVLHWSVDNYGNGRTPIMGSLIAGFQGHHSAPWTITERGFFNNVYKLCIPFGVVPMAIITAIAGPSTAFFFTVFCCMEILSQEFHKWSHMTKGEVPAYVNWLQDVGLSVGRQPHALHHKAPYDGNYCIVSGFCNDALDESGIFRRMEHIVYNLNGVESNAWKLDEKLRERTLNGEYGLPN